MAANIALVKNWTLHGVFWGSYMQHNPRVLRASLEQLALWLGEGKLHVPVSHRCDLPPPSCSARLSLHRGSTPPQCGQCMVATVSFSDHCTLVFIPQVLARTLAQHF